MEANMSTTKKKYIVLVLVVLIGLLVALFSWSQKDQEGSTGGLFSFFGSGDIKDPTPGGVNGDGTGNVSENPSGTTDVSLPYRKITDGPISGFSIATESAEGISLVYQERAQGYVQRISTNGNAAVRFSSTTFPGVYESVFGKLGQMAYVRTLTDEEMVKTTLFSTSKDVSHVLPNNIASIVASPDTQKAFYLAPSSNGLVGYTTTFDTASPKKIFSSRLSELVASWTSPSFITLTSKASAYAPGSISLLNTKTLAQTTVLVGKTGLTGNLSYDGSTLLYGAIVDSRYSNHILSLASGVDTVAPFTTIPEKCLWEKKNVKKIVCAVPTAMPSANYPDDWYQGTVGFTDTIWVFDLATGSSDARAALPAGVDAISLTLNSEESFLFFINKNDGSLWMADL